MPLFEYTCSACGTRFEALVQGSRKAACSACGSKDLRKLHSTFAVSSSGSASAPSFDGGGGAGCGTCGDPRGPGSCKSDA